MTGMALARWTLALEAAPLVRDRGRGWARCGVRGRARSRDWVRARVSARVGFRAGVTGSSCA